MLKMDIKNSPVRLMYPPGCAARARPASIFHPFCVASTSRRTFQCDRQPRSFRKRRRRKNFRRHHPQTVDEALSLRPPPKAVKCTRDSTSAACNADKRGERLTRDGDARGTVAYIIPDLRCRITEITFCFAKIYGLEIYSLYAH